MIKDKIITLSRRLIRSIEYEDQFETLFYFLNSYADITKVPKATGPLRKMQECDAILLKIFDEVCRENNLRYWIDFGTLLGCYRHGGFIPWDDDMDVGMLREDYEKAVKILPEAMRAYGIDAIEKAKRPSVSIGVSYQHEKTGIWLDVFPVDVLDSCDGSEKGKDDIRKIITKYRKYYTRNQTRRSREVLGVKRNDMYKNMPKGHDRLISHGPEFMYPRIYIHNYDDIFPLKTAKFEEYEVSVPNNVVDYLSAIYGNNFMSFPKNGIAHHGSEDGKLYQWAENSGTNMDEVKEVLAKNLESFRKK